MSGFSSGTTEPPMVIIEPNRQMQYLLRTMLANYNFRHVRIYDELDSAVAAMLSDPPSVVLLDWNAGPYGGAKFLKLIRHEKMFPLCLVPIIALFTEARQNRVESALRLGAQAALVKPVSPAVLVAHIMWASAGERKLKLVGERYVIEGMSAQLDQEKERREQLNTAREYQNQQIEEMTSIQDDVDRILTASF